MDIKKRVEKQTKIMTTLVNGNVECLFNVPNMRKKNFVCHYPVGGDRNDFIFLTYLSVVELYNRGISAAKAAGVDIPSVWNHMRVMFFDSDHNPISEDNLCSPCYLHSTYGFIDKGERGHSMDDCRIGYKIDSFFHLSDDKIIGNTYLIKYDFHKKVMAALDGKKETKMEVFNMKKLIWETKDFSKHDFSDSRTIWLREFA